MVTPRLFGSDIKTLRVGNYSNTKGSCLILNAFVLLSVSIILFGFLGDNISSTFHTLQLIVATKHHILSRRNPPKKGGHNHIITLLGKNSGRVSFVSTFSVARGDRFPIARK